MSWEKKRSQFEVYTKYFLELEDNFLCHDALCHWCVYNTESIYQ